VGARARSARAGGGADLQPPRSLLPARPSKAPRRGHALEERFREDPSAHDGEGGGSAPRQRRAFATYGGPVTTAGEPGEARALGELWDVDPGLARALTHGFHSYAGRMHPSIARAAVARYSRPRDTVVDPFCGSGTVLVESMGLGRSAVGIDASPLGVAIAQVRTNLLGAEGRATLVAEATRIAEASGENARKRRRPEVPAWGKREFERFFPHVAFELFGLRALVMETPGKSGVGQALRLCLSSILVKVMRAGPEAPRDGADKRIGRGVPSRLLIDRATELARGLAALEKRTPAGTPTPRIELGDARALPVEPGTARLVLSSPPYAGTYDYAAQHDVRFAWLELPRRKFESTQMGARKVDGSSFGADPVEWPKAQAAWMREVARVLMPGGHALLVVGDGIVGDVAEDAPSAVAAVAEPVGLRPVARASQTRHMMDRRLRALFGEQPRCEHLLLLRKI
jgi:SAM-dependent methyltransferase